MKQYLLTTLIFISLAAGAQTTTTNTSVAQNGKRALLYEKYGYVDDMRLDSLPSKYIQASVLSYGIYIDYGQRSSFEGSRVTDSEGKKISFGTEGFGVQLNFLDYNGWEYLDNYVEQSSSRSSFKYIVLRKKR